MTSSQSHTDFAAVIGGLFDLAVVDLRQLQGEHDQNFWVRLADGTERLVKWHHHQTDRAALEMQNAAMNYVSGRDVPTGALIAETTVEGRPLRILEWIQGTVWSHLQATGAVTGPLLFDLGRKVATLDRALVGFEHPALGRPYRWNMLQAERLEPPTNAWAAAVLHEFATDSRALLTAMPQQAIHNDASENNIIVVEPGAGAASSPSSATVRALIDFGDLVRGPRIIGLGIAAAYAMLGQQDPLAAAMAVVAGYHFEVPLTADEVVILRDVIRTRWAMSIANAESQARENPSNEEYLSTSQAGIRACIELFDTYEQQYVHAAFRHAVGLSPVPSTRSINRFFWSAGFNPAPLVDADLSTAVVFDWSVDSTVEKQATAKIHGDAIGIGRYGENRGVYNTDAFATPFGERRTVHLGIDVFVPEGANVYSPLDGKVHSSEYRADRGDYGGVVMLEYRTDDYRTDDYRTDDGRTGDDLRHAGESDSSVPFWLLIGHLSRASAEALTPGRTVTAGECIAHVGGRHENGGWEPHLHAQMYTDLLGKSTDLPGVCRKSHVELWKAISPSPAPLIVGVGATAEVPIVRDDASIIAARRTNLSTSLSLSYRTPIHVVKGRGAYLIDCDGNEWLDLVNNVAHVGHEHPAVVEALTRQAELLNTNTRYLHPNIVEYAQRIRDLLPDPLSVVFFTNSGSEANDLALRIARTVTGAEGVLTMDWGYHGNLSSLIEVSPYKFNRKGGAGPTARVRICDLPDPYRGRFGSNGPEYAIDVARQADSLRSAGLGVAAFIHESISGCGGQVELASGYLADAYQHARAVGALTIADEVQCGLGRVGTHMWAFETHDVVPDIVTMGKPVGNGHPLGIVVTTSAIARQFRTGMEYFNTFGGNPVSCAVGLAVLDVMADEALMGHAHTVGAHLKTGLARLAGRHRLVGDVRGRGLFLGVDLVRDRVSKEPATVETAQVVEAMKAQGILLSSDGPHDNVLKIKPPLVITVEEADRVVAALDQALDLASNSALHVASN
jgi:4-aminobutyrate aminotransferase-like enzyme/Ser/Thr protein kinase RdoA (MazF antagonist)